MTVAPDAPVAEQGLFARIFGVLLSPRETYAAVAAKPRSLGVLAVILVVIGLAQGLFLYSEIGKELVLDQQIRAMEAFGFNVPDQVYDQMERSMERAYITGPISQVVFWPVALAFEAGILVVIFSLLMGGAAKFKQAYAVAVHSSVIVALQQVFSVALSYASAKMAGANLAIFVPMLDEKNVVTLFLGTIDLFFVWSTISLAIGLGVLYKRRTGPIATTFLGIYVLIALVIAFFRSGS